LSILGALKALLLASYHKKMAQTWTIIMPHDRIILRSFPKLNEYIFDGSAGYIAEQLAVSDTDWIENSSSGNAWLVSLTVKSIYSNTFTLGRLACHSNLFPLKSTV
jgi:hypothetical protein